MIKIEEQILDLWPQFDMQQIARLVGRGESFVYNTLASNRCQTERKVSRPIDNSFKRPRLEVEELLAS